VAIEAKGALPEERALRAATPPRHFTAVNSRRLIGFARADVSALVEGDDLDPVRALAGRVAPGRLERAALGVDRTGCDHVR
jgi:hypothetical protein